jgi:lipopolysaccharide/colanic/teichoic acid biosynthesis glycosyltransferase
MIKRAIKRVIDVGFSSVGLLLMSPIIAVIVVLIKLTSKGPVIFKQERMGQFGKTRFNCLKFRTMYVNNDPHLHREFVRQLIESGHKTDGQTTYKIVDDPRVTSIGKFLRKSSLDELPQLWNILIGDMALVGPRPPVPYEFEMYKPWHRERLNVMPGLTGLWQVSGRNKLSFDDMVRLDLHYCEKWSPWMDLKIICATPLVIFTGHGAH